MNKNVNCVLSSYVLTTFTDQRGFMWICGDTIICIGWLLFVFKGKYARDSPTKSYCAVGVN